MPIPAWPGSLPFDPDRDQFRRPQHHRPILKTEVEDGPDLRRVQSQTVIRTMEMRLMFDDTQLNTFDDFVVNTLSQGTSDFTMQVLIGNTFQTRRVYIEDGDYEDEPFGDGRFLVTFSLKVFPA